MKVRSSKALLALGATLAVSVPSAAQAHGGDRSGGRDNAGDGSHNSGRPGGETTRVERFDLRGTVVSVNFVAQTAVVRVKKANHGRRGRALIGGTITVDVSSARFDVRDVNGDGVRDLNDVTSGDPVEVRVELSPGAAGNTSGLIVAQRFRDPAKGAGDNTEQGSDTRPEHHGRGGAGAAEDPAEAANHG